MEAHSRPYVPGMSKDEYGYLKHIFFFEIKELEQMLSWDCSDWLQDGSFLNY